MVAASVVGPVSVTAIVRRSDAQLLRPVAEAKEILELRVQIANLVPQVLEEGKDFGKLPGAASDAKPMLYKAGAERLCDLFGLVSKIEIVKEEIDHDRVNIFKTAWTDTDDKPDKKTAEDLKKKKLGRWKNRGSKDSPEFVWQVRGEGEDKSFGLYRYVLRCVIEKQDGTFMGECYGSCSTLESKYIDRPRDCENAVIKIGQKRAYVGAVLVATKMSDRFSADMDDHAGEVVKRADDVDVVVEAEIVDPRDPKTGEKDSKYEAQMKAAKAEEAAALEARKAAAAKEQALAMRWVHDHIDRVDKVSVLSATPTDEERKGAYEAFATILDEDAKAMEELKVKAPKLHLAVTVYDGVIGAHLTGVEPKLDAKDQAAFAWLNEQRNTREIPPPAEATA